MSFTRGDLLTKTRKLVKGLAKAEPRWLKAMEQAPPATFPRIGGEVKRITLPEDVYIKKFFNKYPDSKHEDAFRFDGFDPPPARIYGQRVVDLKEQGVSEEEAMAVADMEYQGERKAKKQAYKRLKQIARMQGKKPPPNPYPSAIKEIQAEERKYVRDRFFNPKTLDIVRKMKEEKAVSQQDRFGWGVTGSWDSAEVGSPVVKRFLSDEEERWYMWYYGRSNTNTNSNPALDSIGLAVSSNGIHWKRGGGPVQTSQDVGLVMSCGKDWWAFDTLNIRPSEVVIMSSTKIRASNAVYWLYYSGCSFEEAEISNDKFSEIKLENPERFYYDDSSNKNKGSGEKIFKSLPGLAISQDGRHWARIEGEHHSGALFDVGLEGECDSSFIAAPQVVFHGNGDLRMYYHSFDVENGHFGIGIARSRDGIKWVKLGKIIGGGKSGSFDELGVVNACVVRNRKDGKYLMVYEGVDSEGGRSVGLAVSIDGLKKWSRFQDEAILKASVGNGWDNKMVGSPCLVHMDGEEDEWRMYYRGIGNEGRIGIGMAASQGSDFSKFKRWTGFVV